MKVIYCQAMPSVCFLFKELKDEGRYDTECIMVTEETGAEECKVSVSKIDHTYYVVRTFRSGSSVEYVNTWVGRNIHKKVSKQIIDMVQSSDQESVVLGMAMLKELIC